MNQSIKNLQNPQDFRYPRKQLAQWYTISQLHSKPPFHDIVNNTKVFIYYHTSYLANANGTTINILETHRDACCDKVISFISTAHVYQYVASVVSYRLLKPEARSGMNARSRMKAR